MSKKLDLVKIKKALKDFSVERDWEKFHNPKNLSMALSVEVSELVEIFQWVNDGGENIAIKERNKIEEEIADIFNYLVKLVDILDIDLEKGNIDLIPTTKNMTKDPTKFEQKQTSIPKTITKNLTKETTKPKPNKTSIRKQKDNAKSIEQENLLLEKEKKEHERIDTVLENIIESGGKDTMKFFTRFITKNIKENNSEWSLTIPRNKKNTIRLYNNSLDGSYINDKGLMVVLMTPDEKSSADLKYLVDKHVSPKDRQGKYTKVPKAIPLFMTYDELKGTKKYYTEDIGIFLKRQKTSH